MTVPYALALDYGLSLSAKAWLSMLEASGIICLLEPYHKNFGKRLVKSPKLYFVDTCLETLMKYSGISLNVGIHQERRAWLRPR